MSNLSSDQSLYDFLRPTRDERVQWTFRLGLELTQNPGLIDRIVDPSCSWDGLHATVLSGCWHMLGPVKKTGLAGQFLDKMILAKVAPLDVVRATSLLPKELRHAWLDFVEQRHVGTVEEKFELLRGTMRSLLNEWLHSRSPDVGQETPMAWIGRWLDITERLNPQYRVWAANTSMSDLIESCEASPIDDMERVSAIAHALVAGGAELNEPRRAFYEQIDGVANEERITHPDRVHETLYRWKRMGGDPRKNELAAILVDLGGDWKASWNDPQIKDVARSSLMECAAVRRHRLGEVATQPPKQVRKPGKM